MPTVIATPIIVPDGTPAITAIGLRELAGRMDRLAKAQPHLFDQAQFSRISDLADELADALKYLGLSEEDEI